MLALYIVLFLATLLVLGIFHLAGKRKFGSKSEHHAALSRYIKTCVRIVSVIGAVSILLISANVIPAERISFLCIPFFVVLAGSIGWFFRILRDFNLTKGYKKCD